MPVHISQDDLSDGTIEALLNEHLQEMYKYSPPESIHALDSSKLRDPAITFWAARVNGELAGCGAIKELDQHCAEIKSMKTAPAFTRQGVATKLLEVMIEKAKQRSYKKLLLETGSDEAFVPAIRLYVQHGFKECKCFGDYKPDPFSKFYNLNLAENI